MWHDLRFASDVKTEKFRKLMGIRQTDAPAGAPAADASRADGDTGPGPSLQRQDELFHELDRQYAAARSVTHTQRGSGLGFGSC